MTFQDDLDYAKQFVILRDAFISGEMDDYGYIKRVTYSDSVVFKYTLPASMPTVFRMNEYGFDGVSSFQPSDGDYTAYHHNDVSKIWIPEIEDWLLPDMFECTEEFHFQQSLLYSEKTLKEMLTFAYLMENPMPYPYQYMRLNMKYFFEMQGILNLIRDRKRNEK